MYREKKIALVIPAYREEKLIRATLLQIPALFDKIYVVDDCSPDQQNAVVLEIAKTDRRVNLLKHSHNTGPGGGIITGYLQADSDANDIVVVIGGDHQMDLAQVQSFLDPIVENQADYTKGNRFLLKEIAETMRLMPRVRLFGNLLLTALTKIASGYYKVMDVVDGYTAISRRAIQEINWKLAWKGYGYPMDFLVRLNAYGLRVKDVPRTAIYTPGERQSQIKGFRYAMKVSPMLLRDFFWRLRFKYIYRDFHPLVFFYYFSILMIPTGIFLGLYLVWDKIFAAGTAVTGPRAIFIALILISGFQFLFFAMLFDMEESNQR